MAGFGMFNSNSISTLFSSVGNKNSSSLLDLSQLSSIRNGSYKKLLTAYYKNTGSSDKNMVSDVVTPSATEKTNAMRVRDEALSVSDSIEALNKSDLWKKTDKDGKEEYDKDAIYKAVSSFVKEYNTLLDGTADSSDKSVLSRASNMVGFTKANKDLLNSIGVSIGSDNKLSVDEDKFKSADMIKVKSAFTGAGSYGKSVAGTASMIYGSAVSQLAKLSTTNSYGSDGRYSYVTGSTYNKFL